MISSRKMDMITVKHFLGSLLMVDLLPKIFTTVTVTCVTRRLIPEKVILLGKRTKQERWPPGLSHTSSWSTAVDVRLCKRCVHLPVADTLCIVHPSLQPVLFCIILILDQYFISSDFRFEMHSVQVQQV